MSTPGLSALDPVGPQAARLEQLWWVFFAVAAAVTVAVLAVEVAAIVRATRRARAALPDDPLHRDDRAERRATAVIIAATAVTIAVLVGLLVLSVSTGHALAELAEDEPLTVRITGHQWWWQVVYDPSKPSRMATANELHVPVGRTVKLELASADVIHSLWIPGVHGKKDLVPGRDNVTWIRVDEPGRYRGLCAEFCGLQHANMGFELVAEPEAEFQAWRAAQGQPATPPTGGAAARGHQLFHTGTCAMCHAIAGTSAGGMLGPDLTHVASRSRIAAGSLPNTHAELAGWISTPQEHKPGTRMPASPLAQADIDALVAYLETLR